MRHLELFSGIGGFRKALSTLENDFDFVHDCVGFSEIDKKAIQTYKNIHEIKKEIELGDIIAFNSDDNNISSLPDFDLLTAGFPCQPFSMMGNQKGFDDDRGTMIFQVLKILSIKKPKYVLLENVRNILTHNKGKTIKRVVDELKNCGYKTVEYDVFNTSDYKLPQTRNRVIIFAAREVIDDIEFTSLNIKEHFERILNRSSIVKFENTHELLQKSVPKKYYLSEKIKPTILADGSANFKSHSDINLLIARPLTATMSKMHRACQDNYYSEGYIRSKNPKSYVKRKYSKEQLLKQKIRKLTPGEAFLLQGFGHDCVEIVTKSGVSDCSLYHQIGNAVSVNVIYAIAYYLFVEKRLG